MEDRNDYYTTKEVAALLNKSVPTIYKYVREGKLTPLPDHKWRMQSTRLFPKDQVEELKEKQEKKLGLTTSEAADYLGITRSTLFRFIKEEKIPSVKGTLRGREVSYINEEDLQRYAKENFDYLEQERIKKRTFYDKKQNIAFYQRFSSSKIEEARLIWDEKGEWQFLLLPSRKVVSYNEGIYKYDLCPFYSLTYGKNLTSPGFAKVTLPLNHPLTMQFIDLVYQQCDLSNVYIDFNEAFPHEMSEMSLLLKNTIFDNTNETISQYVKMHLVEGSLQINSESMRIESDEVIFTLHMSKMLKDQIKRSAEEQRISMQEIANQILMEHFDLLKRREN
ncbi:hypothetical protein AWH48_19620 [Domibacillus aminovorans]|uniref:Helix-turn-helix domain-containing protein n=1 Tax=Domibacillus aminovorans TaxID=29332 RepID=A0A177KUL8_9BACI|nr:helix-turn-helix domain-containing protein [Domibacillus aminovorans]OAH56837.1 hypothetical protein AWH48_19620 [Domibacillus aminovorans]